jgi:hypothetical protein
MIDDTDGEHQYQLSKQDEKILLDTLGLLAYEVPLILTFIYYQKDPHTSPLAYLLADSTRHELSNDVNKLILESQKLDAYSALERVYTQFVVCRQVMSQESIGCGDALKFNVN